MKSDLKSEVIELLKEEEKIKKRLQQIAYDIAKKDNLIANGMEPKDIAYKRILRAKLGVVI